MPDPTDPRLAALNNIQASSRAYGRNRRRGVSANEDPALQAALEIADPEQRRAALAQYARERAAALFPDDGARQSGGDLVRQAFPDENAFAGVQQSAAPLPSQADVMGQVEPDADDGMPGQPGPSPDMMDIYNDRQDDRRIENDQAKRAAIVADSAAIKARRRR